MTADVKKAIDLLQAGIEAGKDWSNSESDRLLREGLSQLYRALKESFPLFQLNDAWARAKIQITRSADDAEVG